MSRFNRTLLIQALGRRLPVHTMEDRATLRSTALVLQCVQDAIDKPGEYIKVYDHHDTLEAHQSLHRRVRELCDHLGFGEDWVFNEANLTIMNNAIVEIE